MSVKKSVKKSKYERKMRKHNPEWGSNRQPDNVATNTTPSGRLLPTAPPEFQQIPIKVRSVPAHIRRFIRLIVE